MALSMTYTNSGPPSQSGYAKLWGIDPKYVVKLSVSGEGGEADEFETTMDETLSLNLGAQWAAPFENVLQEVSGALASRMGVGGKATAGAGVAMKALGLAGKNRLTSAQIWQSSDPMQITVPFTFIATTDPAREVRDRVRSLLKMVAPSEVAGILHAPGPTLLSEATGGRTITLKIGTYFTLTPCIVDDVQVQFDNVIGEAGIPLKAKVNIQVKSWYSCFTTTDIDSLFNGGVRN